MTQVAHRDPNSVVEVGVEEKVFADDVFVLFEFLITVCVSYF